VDCNTVGITRWRKNKTDEPRFTGTIEPTRRLESPGERGMGLWGGGGDGDGGGGGGGGGGSSTSTVGLAVSRRENTARTSV
jgi:hypothetical protein